MMNLNPQYQTPVQPLPNSPVHDSRAQVRVALHLEAHRLLQQLRVRRALHVHHIVDASQAIRDGVGEQRLEPPKAPPALHGQGSLEGERGGLLRAGGGGGGRAARAVTVAEVCL